MSCGKKHKSRWKIVNKQDILTIFGILTLLIGLGSSFSIYYMAGYDEGSILGYEVVGGSVFPISPEDSRRHIRDLQAVGGNAYVLIDQFERWVRGLLHGKSAAYMAAGITILISAGFFYAANNLPFHSQDDDGGEKSRGSL